MRDFPSILKVVTLPNGLIDNSSGTVKYQSDFYILEYLAEKLKFKYEIVIKQTDKEMLQEMYHSQADLGLYSAEINANRYKSTDFSVSYNVNDIRFVIEETKTISKMKVFAIPFDIEVWITLLLSAVTAAFLLKLTAKASFSLILLSIFGSVLKQPFSSIKTIDLKKRIFYGVWFSWTGAISPLYIATFLSSLTVFTKEWIPRNFKDLSYAVQNKGFISRIEQEWLDFMIESKQEHLKILADEIVENGWIYAYNTSRPFYPIRFKEAYIDDRWYIDLAELHPPNRVKVFSEDALFVSHIAVEVRKDFCCKENLNLAMQQGIDMGLFYFFEEKPYLEQKWRRELHKLEWKEENSSQIKLEDLQYAFYLLFIGYALSFIVFLFERISRRCRTLWWSPKAKILGNGLVVLARQKLTFKIPKNCKPSH